MRKLLFITGTRADYGKMKSLMMAVEKSSEFELNIFVSGMHLIENLGSTYKEVLKDGYKNIYVDFAQVNKGDMSYDLGVVISNLTSYVHHIKPDMIVVHGDRNDALAGAVVGALNNIRVSHVEGGELSGTIDESIRHAISKFAHFHLVSNQIAYDRLIQMGEDRSRIFVIGSPDIDVMFSEDLPTLEDAKERYQIPFSHYAILMYHPVTTEEDCTANRIKEVVSAVIESGHNYIVVYPNNDTGANRIIEEYKRLYDRENFRIFPSLRFEHFLTLLKNADYMIGNSSAGVRETGVYGIPAIDIGTRQSGRFILKDSNIQHVEEDEQEILTAIKSVDEFHIKNRAFGDGKSTERFMEFINEDRVWNSDIQKHFVDRETL